MMTDAFLFPGQGSQSVGMMNALAEAHPLIESTFAEASEALGADLAALVRDGPAETLNQTKWTQPAMLVSGVATYRVWLDKGGVAPDTMAGHSLGEISALVCAGAVALSDATRLVARRAQLMQSAVAQGEGAMVAIIGLKDEQVVQACRDVANGDIVEPVNFNAPGQVVVAGTRDAVARLATKAAEVGARRVLPLPVSVPSHSSLMLPAAEKFAVDLAGVEFRAPTVPIIHNAGPVEPNNADAIRQALARQIHSPVMWTDTIQGLLDGGTQRFYECGPGRVLTGLVKRIHRRAKIWSLHDAASLDEALLEAAELEHTPTA